MNQTASIRRKGGMEGILGVAVLFVALASALNLQNPSTRAAASLLLVASLLTACLLWVLRRRPAIEIASSMISWRPAPLRRSRRLALDEVGSWSIEGCSLRLEQCGGRLVSIGLADVSDEDRERIASTLARSLGASR